LNAVMNIRVQVLGNAARAQIQQLQAQLRGLQTAQGMAGLSAAGMARGGITSLTKWGNQIQWAGRQLQYNFTLPIALAGGLATKFALDNEKAFTRVQKVYGDTSMSQKQMLNETNALRKSFELLSNEYGVAQADVINMGADWAAAGASGVALAKATKLTIETMILGEMDSAKATQSLIAIQAQYGMSVGQLSKTIDILNMVENQTGTSMADLIDVMSRSAGVARQYGVDQRHLAAMTAALVPAAGSAAAAGNGLKTILTRMMVPTKQAAELMKLMGINVHSASWESLNATQRLEAMAKSFTGLSNAQQAQVAKQAAGIYQINRFGILMDSIVNKNGYYQKALNSSGSAAANYAQSQKELNMVLNSSPQRLKILTNLMKNAAADIIQPLIPLLLSLVATVQHVVTGFSNLNPSLQKLVLVGLLVLAMVGPLARYVGSVAVLFGILGEASLALGGKLLLVSVGMARLITLPFSSFMTLMGALGGVFMSAGSLAARGIGLIAPLFAPLLATATATFSAMLQATTAFGVGIASRAGIGALAAVRAFGGVMLSGFLSIITRIALITGVPLTSAMLGNLIKMPTLLGPILANIASTVAAGLAPIVLTARRYAAMFVSSFIVPILAAVYSMIVSMATASIGLWATMQSIWITGAAKVQVVLGALWTRMTSSLIVAANEIAALMAQAWTVIATGIATVFSAGMALVSRIYAAAGVGMTVVTTRLNAWLVAAWEAMGTALGAVWEATQLFIRTAWTATLTFLGSPQLIGRAVLSIASKLAFLIPSFETITTALMAIWEVLLMALTNPWTYVIAAILALAYEFRNQLKRVWLNVSGDFGGWIKTVAHAFSPLADFFNNLVNSIEKAFYRLPAGVQSAFLTVVKIVEKAALKVYDLFSYFNPFAHHSPSLVENVQKGMAVVAQHHSKVADVGGTMSKAANDVQNFKGAVGSITPEPFANERSDLSKVLPSALPEFDKLIADYKQLNVLAKQAAAAVNAQQAVVDKWKASLDAANVALDNEQSKLDGLQKGLDSLNAAYQQHQDALNSFASAPIKGMKDMNDQIFANQQAQKKLQLQMLQWEQVNGSVDDLNNKMASLAGDIEKLQGQATSLRESGAGSDILGPINQQISAMQSQYKALNGTIQNSPIDQLQQQLNDLQTQGQILDLQNSLDFDPLQKQIADLANTTKELSFDDIIAGIKKEQAAMADLQPKIDDQTKAVNDQKAAVDAATAARDAISKRYDAESAKLETLKKQYDSINQSIQDITQAINDMGSAASAALAKTKVDNVAADFNAAANGNFPDVGGSAQIGREGGAGDQTSLIDDFNKQLSDQTSQMFGKFDMFKPLKDAWKATWKWIDGNVVPVISSAKDAIGKTWNNLGDIFSGTGNSGFVKGAGKDFGVVVDIFKTVWNDIVNIARLFAPDVKKIFFSIVQAAQKIWTQIGPQLVKLGKSLSDLFVAVWPPIKMLAEIIGVVLLFALKVLASILANVLGPALNAIIGMIAGVLQVLSGVIEFLTGIFTGDWSKAWQGIVDIFVGLWEFAKAYFVGAFQVMIGWVKGFVEGIVGFFQWLYDVLVGHSIIPDLVTEIIRVFNLLTAPIRAVWNVIWAGVDWLWNKMVIPLWNAVAAYLKAWATIFGWVWTNVISPAWNALWNGVHLVWDRVAVPLFSAVSAYIKLWATIFGWIWNNVISPAWNALWAGIKWVWDHAVVPFFGLMKTGIEGWANIFKDIYTKIIKPAWDAIWNGIEAVWNKVAKPLFDRIASSMKSIMNTAIDAVNFLIRGINKVAGLIHISIGIDEIPKFAAGGQMPYGSVGGGFKTNGPRAIVGEGNQAYPEYVIPTDPKYRRRAMALWASAGKDIQLLAGGGVLGKIGDIGGEILDGGKKLVRGAAATAFVPFKDSADAVLNRIPVDWVRGIGKKFLNDVYDWIKGVSNEGQIVGKATGSPEDHARTIVEAARRMNLGKGGAIVGLITGMVESGLKNYANSKIKESLSYPHDVVGSNGYSAGIMQQQTGPFGNYWGTVAQVMDPMYAATRFYKELVNKDPGWRGQPPGVAAQTVQVSSFPDAYGQRVGDAQAMLSQIGGYLRGGVLPAFREGGIATRATLGVFGESGHEVLAPLAPLWKRLDRIEAKQETVLQPSQGGGDLHFHGDLVFPNINNGNDAEQFIKNLKGLG
jgi:TP901 family phage tail tape measure protein